MIVPPEINAGKGALLLVGRDPGTSEVRRGRPFVGPAGQILDACLQDASVPRSSINIANVVGVQPRNNDFNAHHHVDVDMGVKALHALVREVEPAAIVAMGAHAAYALIEGWPTKDDTIFGAHDIKRRRGYWWDTPHGPVLATLHPAGVLPHRDPSGIGRLLFTHDLKVAKEVQQHGLQRPIREVEVVTDVSAARAAGKRIKAYKGRVACDIENAGNAISCVGFAPSGSHAYVFAGAALRTAFELLADPNVHTIWQNAQYDLHFLLTRCGVRVNDPIDDTIVGWHTLWPEIAGRAEDRKGPKRTYKNLAFFASIYTRDAWWKDYDFQTEHERYVLNGRDCCITHDVWGAISDELEEHGLGDVYRSTLSRVWPVVHIQRRGICVDDAERIKRRSALEERRTSTLERIRELSRPILEDAAKRGKLDKPHLIWRTETCTCCRNGKGKRTHCWQCAGLAQGYKVADLRKAASKIVRANNNATAGERFKALEAIPKMKKAQLVEQFLKPCEVCGGRGQWQTFDFNPASNDQKRDLLYNALKLPERAKVDESTLKDIIGWLHAQRT